MGSSVLDVNDDGSISPTDAILTINELNPPGDGPIFSPIPNTNIVPGYPIMIPLDGLLPGEADISYTVSSDRPGFVSGTIPDGNRSLRLSVSSPENNIEGEMVFQLFENFVPRITGRVIELAESGLYDGLTFREIDRQRTRGGDPCW